MDSRHIHHTCHHQHNHNQPPPPPPLPFDRYGRFPNRIFPPVSSSSSTSSTDSDIRLKRKFHLHRKWCACACFGVLAIGLVAVAAGVYYGYHFANSSLGMEQLFRGSFHVVTGDTFAATLTHAQSQAFRTAAAKYKGAIDGIYRGSIIRNAYLGSEILSFDGVEGGVLKVNFNVHMDTHRIPVDAGDLFITLAEAIRSAKGVLSSSYNITVDQDSIVIQERKMDFFVNGERHFPNAEIMLDDHFLPSNEIIVSKVIPSTTTKSESPPTPPSCQPMSVDFCLSFNHSSFGEQKSLPPSLLLEMSSVVASRCHPFVSHFLCSWGVVCGGPSPCLDYCQEVLSNCAHFLPLEMKAELRCDGSSWKGVGSCVPKPGCVESLYRSGQGQRVCDGVMDCHDFSDEIKCPYCKPGHFHCGAGKHCISPDKKCDGDKDCPNGSDEKACLTLAPSAEAAGYVHQYFNEGFLFVHDQGRLGKLCVERNDSAPSFWRTEAEGLLQNIGSSACELLGFRKVSFVRIQKDVENGLPPPSLTPSSYVRIHDPGSSSEVTFTAGLCPSKKVLYVGCNHLECGQRPSHLQKRSSEVGHGDFPWHAILMKNEKHVCDATLITSQWLVTTLDCFRGTETKAKWTVHFGRVRMGSMSPWQQERRIIGMVKSPLGDTLVLIKMASPIIFSDFARHACLPEEEGRVNFPSWGHRPSSANCVRLGWNKQDEVVVTRMHEVGPDLCPLGPGSWFPNTTKAPLCFENAVPGKECLREVKVFPGGPLLCQNQDTKEWVLSGVSAFLTHPKCGIEKSRVTGVGGSTEWILRTIDALSHNATPP